MASRRALMPAVKNESTLVFRAERTTQPALLPKGTRDVISGLDSLTRELEADPSPDELNGFRERVGKSPLCQAGSH